MSGIVGYCYDEDLYCVQCKFSCPAYEEELYCRTNCPDWYNEKCLLCKECDYRKFCKKDCETWRMTDN